MTSSTCKIRVITESEFFAGFDVSNREAFDAICAITRDCCIGGVAGIIEARVKNEKTICQRRVTELRGGFDWEGILKKGGLHGSEGLRAIVA